MHVPRNLRRAGAVAALVGLATLLTACDDPPTTVSTTVGYDCQINSHNGLVPTTTGTSSSTYATTGPQAVAPGGDLEVKMVPAPFSVDGNPTSSGTVTQVSKLVSKISVPSGTSLTSYAIGSWSNVGAGTPTASLSGSTITITVPGPIRAGTTQYPNVATLPTLTMQLKATGPAGSRIDAKMAGTSYSSPGLTFDAQVTGTAIGTLNPSFSCFPSPNPTLHSTLISNDTKAPVITITTPKADQVIVQGTVVKADFSCDDGTGVGVASCVGTVADGSAIDTATVGTRSFTVTATDKEGKVSTQTVSYSVVAPG